jgi:hypothetical protein
MPSHAERSPLRRALSTKSHINEIYTELKTPGNSFYRLVDKCHPDPTRNPFARA